MMKDVENLHQLGIYIGGDIRDDAYLNGKLVDFSWAWTVPHCCSDGEDAQPDGTTGFEDFESFDRMIDNWNEENPCQRVWERFRPNLKVLNRLRSSCPEKECAVVKENATGQRILRNNTRRKYKPWRTWGKRFNLAHYDWRSALEGEAAAARKEQGSQGYCKKGSKFINRKTKAGGAKGRLLEHRDALYDHLPKPLAVTISLIRAARTGKRRRWGCDTSGQNHA